MMSLSKETGRKLNLEKCRYAGEQEQWLEFGAAAPKPKKKKRVRHTHAVVRVGEEYDNAAKDLWLRHNHKVKASSTQHDEPFAN
jgi:hypothetical protein